VRDGFIKAFPLQYISYVLMRLKKGMSIGVTFHLIREPSVKTFVQSPTFIGLKHDLSIK